MLLFDYKCRRCGHTEEVLTNTGYPVIVCPVCHEKTFEKQLSAPAGLQFKGGGFYATDYKGK